MGINSPSKGKMQLGGIAVEEAVATVAIVAKAIAIICFTTAFPIHISRSKAVPRCKGKGQLKQRIIELCRGISLPPCSKEFLQFLFDICFPCLQSPRNLSFAILHCDLDRCSFSVVPIFVYHSKEDPQAGMIVAFDLDHLPLIVPRDRLRSVLGHDYFFISTKGLSWIEKWAKEISLLWR